MVACLLHTSCFEFTKSPIADLVGYCYKNYSVSIQGTFADPWIIPLIQGYVEIREVPVLAGQTSDVAQGRYHHHTEQGRLKKKESDLDLKVKAGGGGEVGSGGGEARAMIEMTEMTSKTVEDEEDDLKGTCTYIVQSIMGGWVHIERWEKPIDWRVE